MSVEQQATQIFKKEVRPLLGEIRDEQKYLDVFVELAKRTKSSRKSMRASDFPTSLQPANYVIGKLLEKGIVTLARGDSNAHFIVDTLNNKIHFQDKWEVIHENRERVVALLRNDAKAQEIVANKFGVTDMPSFLDKLVIESDVQAVNNVVYVLMEKGYDAKQHGLTLLNWRTAANLYTLKNSWMDRLE